MTSNDEWIVAQANRLMRNCSIDLAQEYDAIHAARTALQEAIERGKAEQDKAVAAEREKLDEARALVEYHAHNYQQLTALFDLTKARADALEAKLARLENPDEALVEAAGDAIWQFTAGAAADDLRESGCAMTLWPAGAESAALVAIRALVRTLTARGVPSPATQGEDVLPDVCRCIAPWPNPTSENCSECGGHISRLMPTTTLAALNGGHPPCREGGER